MTLKQNKNETVNVVIFISKMVNTSETLSEFYLRSNFGESNDANHKESIYLIFSYQNQSMKLEKNRKYFHKSATELHCSLRCNSNQRRY